MVSNLLLRSIRPADCPRISQAFKAQGWDKPVAQYEKYVQLQESGRRDVILAEANGAFAGYLTINWQSEYLPFAERGIPEVVDFNVLQKYQRLGIGTRLLEEAEARIKKVSDYAGIGCGVYQDYGAAHILYVKRGYVPDGRGISKNSTPLRYGEVITIDDSVVFHLTKRL